MKFINNSDDLTRYLGIPVKKNIDIKSISTDTRSIKKGALFIAIKGDFFNGNDYVENAISKKACLVITDDKKFKEILGASSSCFNCNNSTEQCSD